MLCASLHVNSPSEEPHHKSRDIDIPIGRELVSLIAQLSSTLDLAYLATNYLDQLPRNFTTKVMG